MRARAQRLQFIERIIKDHPVSSQEKLQEILREAGVMVTQATLSRDLRRLQVWRTIGEDGAPRYLTRDKSEEPVLAQVSMDLVRGCISLDFSGNLAVFVTPLWFAHAFATALERLAAPEVLAVIAGENTVLAILRENCTPNDFKKSLKSRVPEMKI